MGPLAQKPLLHDSPAQHGLDAEQLAPESRHVGPLAQKPLLHDRPAQHGLDAEQLSPEARHVGPLEQKPLLHDRPAQHGVDALHESPCGRQLVGYRHCEFTHARPIDVQHWVEDEHAAKSWPHPVCCVWHSPLELQMSPEQHSSPKMQPVPDAPQVPVTQRPREQRLPVQQSE